MCARKSTTGRKSKTGARKSTTGKKAGGARKSTTGKSGRKSTTGKRKSTSPGGRRKSMGSKRGSKKKSQSKEKDILERRGADTFNFPNGDKYEGEWLSVYPDIFVRDGEGVYTTSDGMTYKGRWDCDLFESGTIEWPCGQKYSGDLVDGRMHGHGTYTFPGRGELTGTFVNNLPVGNITFLDMAGMKYIGRIEPNSATVKLKMLNHLMGGFSDFDLILPEPPPGADEPEKQTDKPAEKGRKSQASRKSKTARKSRTSKTAQKSRASKTGRKSAAVQRKSMKRKSTAPKKK